jgi:hypothetical protein
MAAEVSPGLGAIKTALDIAKGLKDITDAAARNAAVVELTEKILAAEEAQSALMHQIRELEEEVMHLKDWESDKKRYQLAELAPGIVVLAIKDEMRNGEPFHRLCADCAANGKKAYLQPTAQGEFYDTYKCNACGAVLEVTKGPSPQWFGVEDD